MPRAVNGTSSGTLSATPSGRDPSPSPTLVLSQIIILQSLFYLTYAMTLFICDTTLGITSSPDTNTVHHSLIIDQMLNYRILDLGTSPGLVAATGLLVAEIGAAGIAFVLLVGRAKRALDFSITLFIAHLVCTMVYSQEFPRKGVWWVMNAVGITAMTVVGEVLARKSEIRELAMYQNVSSQGDIESQSESRADLSEADSVRTAF